MTRKKLPGIDLAWSIETLGPLGTIIIVVGLFGLLMIAIIVL